MDIVLRKDVQKRLGEEELTLKLTEAGDGLPRQARLRREVRCASAQAGDPEVHRGSALGEDPHGEFAKGDEIEVDVAPDGEKLDFRVMTKASAA